MTSAASGPVRVILAGLGVVCVALGAVGVFVPGLPTTPFLLAASYLFARSSPRLLRRLDDHPVLGAYLRAIREGSGVPLRAKVVTIGVLWTGILSTMVWVLESGPARVWHEVLLLAVAIGVTWYVGFRLPTAKCG
jgi:uncharacterized membrane protein YbaN (DUF454 family)